MVRCVDTTLYTGYTTSLEKRLEAHNTSKVGAKYTKTRRPVVLVYSKAYNTKSEAMSQEYQLKHLTKLEKEALLS